MLPRAVPPFAEVWPPWRYVEPGHVEAGQPHEVWQVPGIGQGHNCHFGSGPGRRSSNDVQHVQALYAYRGRGSPVLRDGDAIAVELV